MIQKKAMRTATKAAKKKKISKGPRKYTEEEKARKAQNKKISTQKKKDIAEAQRVAKCVYNKQRRAELKILLRERATMNQPNQQPTQQPPVMTQPTQPTQALLSEDSLLQYELEASRDQQRAQQKEIEVLSKSVDERINVNKLQNDRISRARAHISGNTPSVKNHHPPCVSPPPASRLFSSVTPSATTTSVPASGVFGSPVANTGGGGIFSSGAPSSTTTTGISTSGGLFGRSVASSGGGGTYTPSTAGMPFGTSTSTNKSTPVSMKAARRVFSPSSTASRPSTNQHTSPAAIPLFSMKPAPTPSTTTPQVSKKRTPAPLSAKMQAAPFKKDETAWYAGRKGDEPHVVEEVTIVSVDRHGPDEFSYHIMFADGREKNPLASRVFKTKFQAQAVPVPGLFQVNMTSPRSASRPTPSKPTSVQRQGKFGDTRLPTQSPSDIQTKKGKRARSDKFASMRQPLYGESGSPMQVDENSNPNF